MLNYFQQKNSFCYLAFSIKVSQSEQQSLSKGFRFAIEPCGLLNSDLRMSLTSVAKSTFEQLGWSKVNILGDFIFNKIFGSNLFDISRWKSFVLGRTK
jgi:hypothetical protein